MKIPSILKSDLQTSMSVLLFVAINLLFYFKYLSRISFPVAIIGSLAYLLFITLLFRFSFRSSKIATNAENGKTNLDKKKKHSYYVLALWILIGLFILSSVFVLQHVPYEKIKVDRWEIIKVFWDSASKGLNPYGVPNSIGNYPGAMPMYFLLYYPFYMINEIGYCLLIALLVWLYFIYRRFSVRTFALLTLLTLSSAPIYWEIVTRSTILVNSFLFAYFFIYLFGIGRFSTRQFYLSAIVGGLLFSTRNVFVLPLLIWAIFIFRCGILDVKRLFLWGCVFALSFALTFLPFFLLWPQEFLLRNPFLTQSSVPMPFAYVLASLFVAFVLGWCSRNLADVFFYSAIVLILIITAHVGYWIARNGWTYGLLSGGQIGDISYYLFSFPFLLEMIARRSNAKEVEQTTVD